MSGVREDRGTTKLDEFRKKQSELEKARRDMDRLRQEAIAELLQRRKEISRELQQLGYEGNAREEPRAKSSPSTPDASDRPIADISEPRMRRRRPRTADPAERQCPLCNVAGHDLRAHRGQEEKFAFTEPELKERGLAT